MPPMMTMTNASMMALPAADSEDGRADEVHVDPQRMDHFGVLAGCSDQQAKSRTFQKLPDANGDNDSCANQEQPVHRERFVEEEDDAGEHVRHLDLQRINSPEQANDFTQYQCQPECNHQERAVIAPV
jgi:hypothetical protein